MTKSKTIILHVCTGASAMMTLLTVFVAYSDRLHPEEHPVLACAGMTFPFFLIAQLLILMAWLVFKWRRAWIPLLALLLSYPAIRTYLPLHFKSTPPEGSIKVISYNVSNHNYVGKGVKTPRDSIFNYLKRENADIVCLQEDRGSRADTTLWLENIYEYNDTVHVSRKSPMLNAVGIHTRFPILKKELIPYESTANGSAAFFLLIGGDTVVVVNNHLESTHLSKHDRKRYNDMLKGDLNRDETQVETKKIVAKLSAAMVKRARQAEAVHQYIEQQRKRHPVIVCGDFNDTPISYVRRTIAEGLTDCYVETGSGLGITFSQSGFHFRIDQIMCSEHFEPYNCNVNSKIMASDHYPIICWLKKVK